MDFSTIVPIFIAEPRILALYILGSAVAGTMRDDSDVDLAVLIEPGRVLESIERADLGAEAAFLLGRDVDVGELSSKNLVYAYEVIMKGKRLFEREAGKVELIEAMLLGMFARFNEERREVLDAYRLG
jgi:predicted nucleotidyltransferase